MQSVIKVTLPKEMADELSRRAKQEGVNRSAQVRRLIEAYLESDIKVEKANKKDLRIQLSDKNMEKLADIAEEHSMSVREYLTKVAAIEMPPRLDVVVQDYYYLSMEINDLVNSMADICASITRTGKVYEQDIKMIIKTVQDIKDLFCERMTVELNARNRLYDEAKKKLFRKIRETRKGTFEEWVY